MLSLSSRRGAFAASRVSLSLALLVYTGVAAAAVAPTAVTGGASAVTATGATVKGTASPGGATATVSFEYGSTSPLAVPATPSTLSSRAGVTNESASLTGLACGTQYFYRLKVASRVATSYGSVNSFTTAACGTTPSPGATSPTVSTSAAGNVTETSAALAGTVTPNGADASVAFEWGTSTLATAAATPSLVRAGSPATTVAGSLTGLACGTTYTYRTRATNSAGTSYGQSVAFTTATCSTPAPSASPPSASTGAASAISATGATLSATVSSNGATTQVSFDYGATTAYGATVAATPATLDAAASGSAETAALAGLSCATTYHYRVRAVNSAGTTLGANQSFTTSACGSTNPPSTADCGSATTHCVGAGQEFATIQAAVNVATAGHTVLVFDGNYAGFLVSRSGTAGNPITVKAQGANANITSVNSAGYGASVNNASYVTIEGFRMANLPDLGIAARGATATSPMHGVVIRNNVVSGSGVSNIYASQVADSLIEGNVVTGARGEHGIYLANGGSDNTIVRGNTISGNAINGLHLNGDISVGGDGLHTNVTIEGNRIFNNAANGMDIDGLQDATIRNNVVYGNGRHGIRVFQIDASAGPKNLRIVNNTVLASGSNAAVKLTEDLGGHTIFNNILVSASGGGNLIVGNTAFRSDENVFVGEGFSVNGGSSMLTLAQWRGLAGRYDPNSILSSVAQLFVDPANADYRLKSGAPAIDAGVASFNGIAAPAVDFAGAARPKGLGFDIGAYESF